MKIIEVKQFSGYDYEVEIKEDDEVLICLIEEHAYEIGQTHACIYSEDFIEFRKGVIKLGYRIRKRPTPYVRVHIKDEEFDVLYYRAFKGLNNFLNESEVFAQHFKKDRRIEYDNQYLIYILRQLNGRYLIDYEVRSWCSSFYICNVHYDENFPILNQVPQEVEAICIHGNDVEVVLRNSIPIEEEWRHDLSEITKQLFKRQHSNVHYFYRIDKKTFLVKYKSYDEMKSTLSSVDLNAE